MLNGMLEFGLTFSLGDICEGGGCNVVSDVNRIEIVDIVWVRNLVGKNS